MDAAWSSCVAEIGGILPRSGSGRDAGWVHKPGCGKGASLGPWGRKAGCTGRLSWGSLLAWLGDKDQHSGQHPWAAPAFHVILLMRAARGFPQDIGSGSARLGFRGITMIGRSLGALCLWPPPEGPCL